MERLPSPLKWHGGKHYLAKHIAGMMPDHIHYVEPYAGGLSVLLAKDPLGRSEVVNDLNAELTNFWACLQNAKAFAEFTRQVAAVPFSEAEYRDASRPLAPEECADGYGRFSDDKADAARLHLLSLVRAYRSWRPLFWWWNSTKRQARWAAMLSATRHLSQWMDGRITPDCKARLLQTLKYVEYHYFGVKYWGPQKKP